LDVLTGCLVHLADSFLTEFVNHLDEPSKGFVAVQAIDVVLNIHITELLNALNLLYVDHGT
jgi:hypothetical protein